MSEQPTQFKRGDQVFSQQYGMGHVRADEGETVIVRFEHGIEECEKETLRQVFTPLQAIDLPQWHAPIEVITRAQAEAIQSTNDTWGVFSQSRIQLLPHQLWVCRRVLESWPTRWLVADDVGLGKTIEAGLILSPLLSQKTIRRFLVICPASLVDQWIMRLRTMFDIRLAKYTVDADGPRVDFWGTHNQVAVSLQTLRDDRDGRHKRLFEGDPWDLLIVDEAHHLNADEKGGATLGYQLVEKLTERNLVRSVVFFTGTPHRGKNYGFLALMKLLRPDLFDPEKPLQVQLARLRQAMIRNNKHNVTDLQGNRLFQQPVVRGATYRYSQAEADFYRMLTEFIVEGRLYATSLDATQGKAVMLVLISMQKLASSSVAAIRRSLTDRLGRIVAGEAKIQELQKQVAEYSELEEQTAGDELGTLEEKMPGVAAALRLMEGEESRLRTLIAAAERVQNETKVDEILRVVEGDFRGEQVLFFTEYTATQSLLMSALMRRYGDACVTFINGNGRADDVVDSSGRAKTVWQDREDAARKFNEGEVRFLVSTEAGGEGIDLQERCHSLIHVDLPWNPMRLHQRVGRLNRYGQKERVEVVSMRNPDTVESMIWDKLQVKISAINLALRQVMDEPEDLLELVLGMTSQSLFRELFSEGAEVPQESLTEWFDTKTARFGGKDALDVVRDLVGNAARFDFGEISDKLPRLDLPALRPFITQMLTLYNRRWREDADGLSFKTPEAWLKNPGISVTYSGMIFDRQQSGRDGMRRIMGVGHRVVDAALAAAKAGDGSVAMIPDDVLPKPLFVFRIYNRVTGDSGSVRTCAAGVELDPADSAKSLVLPDWKLLDRLNVISERRGGWRKRQAARPNDLGGVVTGLAQAASILEERIRELDLPFRHPALEAVNLFWPVRRELAGIGAVDDLDDEVAELSDQREDRG